MKKFTVLFLAALMIFSFSACSDKAGSYEEFEQVPLPETLQENSYDGYTASYDSEKWIYDESLGLFSIYDKQTVLLGNPQASCDNINVVVADAYSNTLTEDDMNALVDGLADEDGIEITQSKMMTFDGEPVIYYDSVVELNDDMIDLLVSSGNITEEQIEDMGGRDALIESGTSDQIGICAVIDGYLVIVTGTYYEEPDNVLEAMNILLQTSSIDK